MRTSTQSLSPPVAAHLYKSGGSGTDRGDGATNGSCQGHVVFMRVANPDLNFAISGSEADIAAITERLTSLIC